MSKLIIGLGTGRCGTVSLSQFFKHQENFFSAHEGLHSLVPLKQYLLPWDKSNRLLYEKWKHAISEKLNHYDFVAETASFLLPYAEDIINDFPDVLFVVLKRSKEGTVASFIKKTYKRNHWMAHDGTVDFLDPVWDAIHPKFEADNKTDALNKYWDMYYKTIDQLVHNYPDKLKVFDYNDLNKEAGRKNILDFIGVSGGNQKIRGNFHYNASGNMLKQFLRKLKDIALMKFFTKKK